MSLQYPESSDQYDNRFQSSQNRVKISYKSNLSHSFNPEVSYPTHHISEQYPNQRLTTQPLVNGLNLQSNTEIQQNHQQKPQ